MLVGRLVGLIESHAEELAQRVTKRLLEDPRTEGYRGLDEEEVEARVAEVYANLGKWLGQSSDAAVEEVYVPLGRERREENIPLSQVVMGLLLVRRNLWQYVDSLGADSMLELRQQLDLELLVVRFFDRAIYHAVRGYQAEA